MVGLVDVKDILKNLANDQLTEVEMEIIVEWMMRKTETLRLSSTSMENFGSRISEELKTVKKSSHPSLLFLYVGENNWLLFLLCKALKNTSQGWAIISFVQSLPTICQVVIDSLVSNTPDAFFKISPISKYRSNELNFVSWEILRATLRVILAYFPASTPKGLVEDSEIKIGELKIQIIEYLSEKFYVTINQIISKLQGDVKFLVAFRPLFADILLPTLAFEEYMKEVKSMEDLESAEDDDVMNQKCQQLREKRLEMLESFRSELGSSSSLSWDRLTSAFPKQSKKLQDLLTALGQMKQDETWENYINQAALAFEIDPLKLKRLILFAHLKTPNEEKIDSASIGVKSIDLIQTYDNVSLDLEPPSQGMKSLEILLDEYTQLCLQLTSPSPSLLNQNCSELDDSRDRIVSMISSELRVSVPAVAAAFLQDVVEDVPICSWNKSMILNWAQRMKEKHVLSLLGPQLWQAIAVMNRAYQLLSPEGHRLYLTQIMAVVSFFYESETRGHVIQVPTGEGKTTIISILATLMALQGKTVDVITTNEYLAAEAVRTKQDFFALFGLSVATNNHEHHYSTGPKKCYTANVLYGCISNFQFDFLGDAVDRLETRGCRSFELSCVILDEIDSLLIDQGGNIAKVSSPFAGMEMLKYVYLNIWRALIVADELAEREISQELQEKAEEIKLENMDDNDSQLCYEKYRNELVKDFYDRVKQIILRKDTTQTPLIPIDLIPTYLHPYVKRKKLSWINSAMKAKYEYHESVQYLIKLNSTDHEDVILIVDNENTGSMLQNTVLSEGLHQFLQLKHNLHLTFESLPSSFISNLAYIAKYDRIFGLTGTLGSTAELKLLNSVYKIQFSSIPSHKTNSFIEWPMVQVPQHKLTESISVATLGQIFRQNGDSSDTSIDSDRIGPRAVLIICENVRDVNLLGKSLNAMSRAAQINIRLFFLRDEQEANQMSGRVVDCGDIIVATNLAGRGADFRTSNELEQNGGLHVIIGYLPCNQRVERQALGRTSRQGCCGTAQIIASRDPTNSSVSFDDLKCLRDQLELQRITQIQNDRLIEIQFHDLLFSKFLEFYSHSSEKEKKKAGRTETGTSASTNIIKQIYLRKDLKELWAFWLDEQAYTISKIRLLLSLVANQTLEEAAEAEFEKVRDLCFQQQSISHWFNPLNCIALVDAYLTEGEFSLGLLVMNVLETDLGVSSSEMMMTYPSYHVKRFELSIETGQEFMRKFAIAVNKVLPLNVPEPNSSYLRDAIEHLRNAIKSLDIERVHLQNLLCGRCPDLNQLVSYSEDDMKFYVSHSLQRMRSPQSDATVVVLDTPDLDLSLLSQSLSSYDEGESLCVIIGLPDRNQVLSPLNWGLVYVQPSLSAQEILLEHLVHKDENERVRLALENYFYSERNCTVTWINSQRSSCATTSNSGALALACVGKIFESTLSHPPEITVAEVEAQYNILQNRWGLQPLLSPPRQILLPIDEFKTASMTAIVRLLDGTLVLDFDDKTCVELQLLGMQTSPIFAALRLSTRSDVEQETWCSICFFLNESVGQIFIKPTLNTNRSWELLKDLQDTLSRTFADSKVHVWNPLEPITEDSNPEDISSGSLVVNDIRQWSHRWDLSNGNVDSFCRDFFNPELSEIMFTKPEQSVITEYSVFVSRPDKNLLLFHLESRLTGLKFIISHFSNLISELECEADGMAIGSKVPNYLLKLNPKIESEQVLSQAINSSEVMEFNRTSVGCIYAVQKVVVVPDETILSSRIQVGVGIGLLGSTYFFPGALSVLGPIANVILCEGLTDIAIALLKINCGEVFHVWEYLKSKVINYTISFISLGLDAISRSRKILHTILKYLKKIEKNLRSNPHFRYFCNLLADGVHVTKRLLEPLLTKAKFVKMNLQEQQQYLSSLKSIRLKHIRLGKIGNVSSMETYQCLWKMRKITAAVTNLSCKKIIYNAVVSTLQSTVTSVCTDRLLDASLHRVMLSLLPSLKSAMTNSLHSKIHQFIQSRTTVITRQAVELTLGNISIKSIPAECFEILSSIAFGLMKVSSNWKIRLTSFFLETCLDLTKLMNVCWFLIDRFLAELITNLDHLSNLQNASLSPMSEEDVVEQVSSHLTQLVYSILTSIMSRTVMTLPQIVYSAYQAHHERVADQQRIELVDNRLQNIVAAHSEAIGMTCGHESLALIIGILSDELSDGTGIVPSQNGYSVQELKELMSLSGIQNVEEIKLNEAGAIDAFQRKESDRGIALFQRECGQVGHAAPCFLINGSLMVADDHTGRLMSLDSYCSQYNYQNSNFLVGNGLSEANLSEVKAGIYRARIERDVDPLGYFIGGPDCYGGGNKNRNGGQAKAPIVLVDVDAILATGIEELKKLTTKRNTDLKIDKTAIPTKEQRIAIEAYLNDTQPLKPVDPIPGTKIKNLPGFRLDHNPDSKRNWEIQRNGTKNKNDDATTVVSVVYPKSYQQISGHLDNGCLHHVDRLLAGELLEGVKSCVEKQSAMRTEVGGDVLIPLQLKKRGS